MVLDFGWGEGKRGGEGWRPVSTWQDTDWILQDTDGILQDTHWIQQDTDGIQQDTDGILQYTDWILKDPEEESRTGRGGTTVREKPVGRSLTGSDL